MSFCPENLHGEILYFLRPKNMSNTCRYIYIYGEIYDILLGRREYMLVDKKPIKKMFI